MHPAQAFQREISQIAHSGKFHKHQQNSEEPFPQKKTFFFHSNHLFFRGKKLLNRMGFTTNGITQSDKNEIRPTHDDVMQVSTKETSLVFGNKKKVHGKSIFTC
jgi:hypothetical protein